MRFHLLRYFLVTSFFVFVAQAAIMTYFQHQTALSNLKAQAESANINLTRTFSNSLWSEFEGLVKVAKDMTAEQLQNAPEQPRLFDLVNTMMNDTNALKVKVFDLKGNTVFSSESKQIGDDKWGNAGYQSALKGIPASEMTHRDTFSAFEQTVEDRDVISSYIPIYQGKKMVGVFEVYSDMTPLLEKIEDSEITLTATILSLTVILYLALLAIVYYAQKIMTRQEKETAMAQSHMAQEDKMASLGRMVAGVSHELNTPLAFIGSNIASFEELLEDIRRPLKYGNKIMMAAKNSRKEALTVRIENPGNSVRDYEEVELDDLDFLLSSSSNGVKQMQELVVNLRNFTRLDRAKVGKHDINAALDNVLYIAKSSMESTITINKDFADIPPVSCMPSQINQVLMNLIVNAGHAVGENGTITLRTRQVKKFVVIDIEDDGPGIPKEHRKHIFDAYYTTKEEGKGTGLGLSICKNIVEQHSGFLSMKTEVGKGSTFTVRLPLSMAH